MKLVILILDISITQHACSTYSTATVNNSHSAIQRVNDISNNKHKERAEANDIEFMPMDHLCYGALSPEFVRALNFLCEKRANLTNSDKTTICNIGTKVFLAYFRDIEAEYRTFQ